LLSQRAIQDNIQFPLNKNPGSPAREVKFEDEYSSRQQDERDFRNRETDISYHMRGGDDYSL